MVFLHGGVIAFGWNNPLRRELAYLDKSVLPDLDPINANLSGIAPLYVMGGDHEILRSEVDRLAEATQRYHVPVEIVFWPNVWHSWHALAPQLPEVTRAQEALGVAIRQKMS